MNSGTEPAAGSFALEEGEVLDMAVVEVVGLFGVAAFRTGFPLLCRLEGIMKSWFGMMLSMSTLGSAVQSRADRRFECRGQGWGKARSKEKGRKIAKAEVEAKNKKEK